MTIHGGELHKFIFEACRCACAGAPDRCLTDAGAAPPLTTSGAGAPP